MAQLGASISRRVWLQTAGAGATLHFTGCVAAPLSSTAHAPHPPARKSNMSYDIVIVGGGPSGLSAALALGRGRKKVLLCDSGPRRNSAATHIHNFVTRDGTPPAGSRGSSLRSIRMWRCATRRSRGSPERRALSV